MLNTKLLFTSFTEAYTKLYSTCKTMSEYYTQLNSTPLQRASKQISKQTINQIGWNNSSCKISFIISLSPAQNDCFCMFYANRGKCARDFNLLTWLVIGKVYVYRLLADGKWDPTENDYDDYWIEIKQLGATKQLASQLS